jgi:hypothetical protein
MKCESDALRVRKLREVLKNIDGLRSALRRCSRGSSRGLFPLLLVPGRTPAPPDTDGAGNGEDGPEGGEEKSWEGESGEEGVEVGFGGSDEKVEGEEEERVGEDVFEEDEAEEGGKRGLEEGGKGRRFPFRPATMPLFLLCSLL